MFEFPPAMQSTVGISGVRHIHVGVLQLLVSRAAELPIDSFGSFNLVKRDTSMHIAVAGNECTTRSKRARYNGARVRIKAGRRKRTSPHRTQ